jgi:hypothetical protein
VDVGGHLAGFAFGVIAGLQLSQVDFAAISVQRQQQSGILAVALVALCWILAL